jgi:hypothetical protein
MLAENAPDYHKLEIRPINAPKHSPDSADAAQTVRVSRGWLLWLRLLPEGIFRTRHLPESG